MKRTSRQPAPGGAELLVVPLKLFPGPHWGIASFSRGLQTARLNSCRRLGPSAGVSTFPQ